MIDDILIVRTNENFKKNMVAEEKPPKKIIKLENTSDHSICNVIQTVIQL